MKSTTILIKVSNLIESKDYYQALEVLKHSLENFQIKDKEDEKLYEKLLQKRVIVNDLLDTVDEEIMASARSIKYPSEESFNYGNTIVKLMYADMFKKQFDVLISTIHSSKYFDFEEQRGAIPEFEKRMGKEALKEQVLIQQNNRTLSKGDIIKISHFPVAPGFTRFHTPESYHILFYDDQEINIHNIKDSLCIDKLRHGLKKSLLLADEEGKERVGLFALGFYYVLKASQHKTEIAYTLAENIADTIKDYFETKKSRIKEVTFCFVNHQTMYTFLKAFLMVEKKVEIQLGKGYQNELIKALSTSNSFFLDELQKITPTLASKSSLLILGPTGTGKSYLAKKIFEYGIKNKKCFLDVNCAMFQPNLAQSELFGYEKGSHSEAKHDKPGIISRANGGTLFLDEVGLLDLTVQGMLLKFLDDGRYLPVGGTEHKYSDVKLIFGTNEDLTASMSRDKFRSDFYYRIMQRIITIPALMDRREDIPGLIKKILKEINAEKKVSIGIKPEAIDLLSHYSWHGNIRQLRNQIDLYIEDCIFNGQDFIEELWIKKHPPENNPLGDHNPVRELERIILQVYNIWNQDQNPKGKLRQNVIDPILAKIYIEDIHGTQNNASQLIGFSTGKDNPLKKSYNRYQSLIEEIKKLTNNV